METQAPMDDKRFIQLCELAEMSGPDSAIAHAMAEVTRLRSLVSTVQCGDCGAVGDVDTADDGLPYLFASGKTGHDLNDPRRR